MTYKGSWSRVKNVKHYKSEIDRIFKKQFTPQTELKGDDQPSNKQNKTKTK